MASIRDVGAYLDMLRQAPAEVALLVKHMLINVTRFFRDERVFEVLQTIARETGLALLIVTHNTQVANASDFIFTMQDGRLVE